MRDRAAKTPITHHAVVVLEYPQDLRRPGDFARVPDRSKTQHEKHFQDRQSHIDAGSEMPRLGQCALHLELRSILDYTAP